MTQLSSKPPTAQALEITHEKVISILREVLPQGRVLDCGAGRGALSWRVRKHLPHLELSACDLFPENFQVAGTTCKQSDLNGGLPFEDGYFDAICSVEVVEHLENRFEFFREIARVLKPGGRLIFTTPNIANLASRMRFLFSGFYTLYKPLREDSTNPLHDHITPLTWYFYRYSLARTGFEMTDVRVDRCKRGAMAMIWLYPIMYLYTRHTLLREKNPELRESNKKLVSELMRFDLMFGRTIIVTARRK